MKKTGFWKGLSTGLVLSALIAALGITATATANRTIQVEDGVIQSVKAEGGCNGNLQGVAALLQGMTPEEAVRRMEGIRCGMKKTSCPDQIAQALKGVIT